MAIAKRQNILMRYLTPFGLKQLADLLIVVASMLIIVGINTNETVMTIALVLYILGSVLAISKCLTILFGNINRRSPVYKSARVNAIVMGVILILSILGLILSIGWYYGA
ncbi:MAG: hypothetical protein LBK70_00645 [Clostridiales bacterium]|jgi:hypothetical protein|nr:hypothetical protein [Clostridiales bacterium]